MQNSKLYSVLSQFDKVEQNRFRKYIESPYFNRSEELIQLFELLTSEINGENHCLEKESLWEAIEPEKEYDDVRFRKYCSDLLKLVEGFLAQQLFDEDQVAQKNFLLEAVGKKQLNVLFKSTMRSANHFLNKFEFRNASYYYSKYEIEKNYSNMTKLDLQRSSKSNIEEIVRNLDIFYIAEKLRLYYKMTARKSVASYDYNFLFLDQIVENIEDYDLKSIPAIAISYQMYLVNKHSEETSHYFKLKDLLAKHSLSFPQEEALDLYYSAINYCIDRINEGDQIFLNELFELYQDLINKEIIFTDGELSPWTFRNIVVIALRLGNFSWAENFIKKYNNKIPEGYRENAVSFNLATLYFYKGEYSKVIQLLQTVEYEDPSYNLNSKAMLIATYYETDEIDPLYSLFESFRVYLNRNKSMPESKKRRYKRLIRFTKKLTKIIPGDQKALNKLKSELAQTKDVVSISWLKEKIAELE